MSWELMKQIQSPISNHHSFNFTDRNYSSTSTSQQFSFSKLLEQHEYSRPIPSRVHQSTVSDNHKNADRQYEENCVKFRTELNKLSNSQLIDLLLGEIEQNKFYKQRLSGFSETQQTCSTLNQNRSNLEYNQLIAYMQEYIGNTNEAQKHFSQIISELREENNKLVNQLKKSRCSCQETGQADIIADLQRSLSHYIEINNENCRKYDVLQNNHEKLVIELEEANHKIGMFTSWAHKLVKLGVSASGLPSMGSESGLLTFNKSQSELSTLPLNQISHLNHRNIRQNSKQHRNMQKIQQLNCTSIKSRKKSTEQSLFNNSQPNTDSAYTKHLSILNTDTHSPLINQQNSLKSQLEQSKHTIKILSIQNRQFNDNHKLMQRQLENKSQKIKQLLAEVQTISQQKRDYKEHYMSANAYMASANLGAR